MLSLREKFYDLRQRPAPLSRSPPSARHQSVFLSAVQRWLPAEALLRLALALRPRHYPENAKESDYSR